MPIAIPPGNPFPKHKIHTGTKVIAVDFDRTVHDIDHPVEGRRMGPPMPGAVEGMQALKARGHELVVFTARPDPTHVEAWLRFYGIPFARVTNVKDATFDVILDDRAIRFTSWAEVQIGG